MNVTLKVASHPTDDQIYGRKALRDGEPWIVPESLQLLESIVQPDWEVFEWGCGGSTVWFARNCKYIIGVEHNTEWVDRVKFRLDKESLTNYTILYVKSGRLGDPERYRSYANTIDIYPDESFDLISVDGEASCRGWCIANALPKLKSGGILLLDNSNLFKVRESVIWHEWDRWDFVAKGLRWVGQNEPFDWWTSIFMKPS